MATEPARGMSLIAADGTRKYLSGAERARFLAAIPILRDPVRETYCEVLFWTGCRPSEALSLTAAQIDCAEGAIVIATLKKRGREKGRHFRQVPVPDPFLARIASVHDLSAPGARLWRFSRSTSWRMISQVMREAGLSGVKASAKGLRHSYGVTAALSAVPETRIKKWLGHASLAKTEIYMDMCGPEDRQLAARMWPQEDCRAPRP